MSNFKTVFTALRKARGLTQAELANRIGISRSAIGMYESGERIPRPDDLEKIADFFNVDLDYLMGRTYKTTVLPETYFVNETAREYADFLFRNPEYRVLFDASRKVKPEDIALVKRLLEKFEGE